MKTTFLAVDAFLDEIIVEHESNNKKNDDFLGILLQLQECGRLDFQHVRDNLKTILMKKMHEYPTSTSILISGMIIETSSSVKLRGYHTTTKIMVFINASTIQRDTKLWDDPGEFIPKRFETNQVDFNGQDFQLISFSIGRKGCPTMSFGLASAQYVLSNLLYWFN
ncbi:hypothetical protein JHK86_010714 [Glycine max]|nr:hypothetical protein JHK86_010714 [Glycine max]